MWKVRARYWCFTENKPDEWLWGEKLPSQVRHMMYQREKAPTTGKIHLQGCFCMFDTTRASYIKENISCTMHFEKMRGSYERNLEYCCKKETRIGEIVELGERVSVGQRASREKIKNFLNV